MSASVVVITTIFLIPQEDDTTGGAIVLPRMSSVESLPIKSENIRKTVNLFPASVNMEVEFTSQAPFAVWDHFHRESCEEASVIMAYAWANGVILNPALVDQELKKIADWEVANFGFFESTNAEQTAKMAREFYGLKVDLLLNPTIEEIKSEVAKGNLIITGVAGRLLGNPHFNFPGPVYHMLVIKGYNQTGFFTNDPGTMHGANFYYPYETVMRAIHDWVGSDKEIYTSPAVALVISK